MTENLLTELLAKKRRTDQAQARRQFHNLGHELIESGMTERDVVEAALRGMIFALATNREDGDRRKAAQVAVRHAERFLDELNGRLLSHKS